MDPPPAAQPALGGSFLAALTSNGFSDEAAVTAYRAYTSRAYTSFLLGHLLLEVAQRGVPITPEDEPEGSPQATVDLADYPNVQRLERLLSEDESAAEFDEALESLLDRLEPDLLSFPRPRRSPPRPERSARNSPPDRPSRVAADGTRDLPVNARAHTSSGGHAHQGKDTAERTVRAARRRVL